MAPQEEVLHRVQREDSLQSISLTYDISVHALKKSNKIFGAFNKLYEGQELRIPRDDFIEHHDDISFKGFLVDYNDQRSSFIAGSLIISSNSLKFETGAELIFELSVANISCLEILKQKNKVDNYLQIGYWLDSPENVSFLFCRFDASLAEIVEEIRKRKSLSCFYNGYFLEKCKDISLDKYFYLFALFEQRNSLSVWYDSQQPSLILDLMDVINLSDKIGVAYKQSFWRLIYCFKQGISLDKLYTNCQDIFPLLLVIETTQGEVFGYYTVEPFTLEHQLLFYGTGDSFLFKRTDSGIETYTWTEKNSLFICSSSDLLGIGSGGSGFGICFDESLEKGTTSACDTYGNKTSLISDTDTHNQFTIANLELFTFEIFSKKQHGTHETRRGSAFPTGSYLAQ